MNDTLTADEAARLTEEALAQRSPEWQAQVDAVVGEALTKVREASAMRLYSVDLMLVGLAPDIRLEVKRELNRRRFGVTLSADLSHLTVGWQPSCGQSTLSPGPR